MLTGLVAFLASAFAMACYIIATATFVYAILFAALAAKGIIQIATSKTVGYLLKQKWSSKAMAKVFVTTAKAKFWLSLHFYRGKLAVIRLFRKFTAWVPADDAARAARNTKRIAYDKAITDSIKLCLKKLNEFHMLRNVQIAENVPNRGDRFAHPGQAEPEPGT